MGDLKQPATHSQYVWRPVTLLQPSSWRVDLCSAVYVFYMKYKNCKYINSNITKIICRKLEKYICTKDSKRYN